MMRRETFHDQFFTHSSNADFTHLFQHKLYGAGSDVITNELGMYSERLIDSGSSFLQSNIHRYLSKPQYYFQVNEEYVVNKLKVILFPFLHKGHWMRISETVKGELRYKAPIYDINAPDLYIPIMAFGTYLLLAGFLLGFNHKFSPEALGMQFTNGLLCWLFQVMLLESTLHALGEGGVPVLDIVAYGGYIFVSASISLAVRILWSSAFYVVALWECFCMGVFLIKTMKRILVAEVRSCRKNSSKRHYLLLSIAFGQIPLLFWLCNFGV